MQVRFWGTRGSIATPGPDTLRYGGNTSCVEVRASDGTLVVLDCGTGAHVLARRLREEGCAGTGYLLIGHTHWDHIQGFPFFEPLFDAHNTWHVYAPGGRFDQLEATLSQQMSYDYHPISLDDLTARVCFHDLREGCFQVGGVRVTTQYLHHPALTIGYRLEADGAVLVYASDHEPHLLHPLDAPPGMAPIHHEDQRHVRFLAGADLVIHDAQYSLEDYPEKAGWGHTPVESAVDYAAAAGARRLALFHHDPDRDDAGVERLCRRADDRAARAGADGLAVVAAAEGLSIELTGTRPKPSRPIPSNRSALLSRAPRRAVTVLVAEDDPTMASQLRSALGADGVRLLEFGSGAALLDAAPAARPSLILLDLAGSLGESLDVCRALRKHPDPGLADVPVLLVRPAAPGPEEVVETFRAGATDLLTRPVKPTLIRSRIGGWLLRAHAG